MIATDLSDDARVAIELYGRKHALDVVRGQVKVFEADMEQAREVGRPVKAAPGMVRTFTALLAELEAASKPRRRMRDLNSP